MKAYFIPFSTSLAAGQLASRRRSLTKRLRTVGVELESLTVRGDGKAIPVRLAMDAKSLPVIALEDANPLPDKAPWLADLTRDVIDLPAIRRPQVIYVTQRASAAGQAQALKHAVVRRYVWRDDRGAWLKDVVDAVLGLIEQVRNATPQPAPPRPLAGPEIVGVSPCFRDAVDQLDHLLRSPYGLVTGEPGVGKLFLIRAMWRQMTGRTRIFVLPCGSFFKDYYVAGRRRIIGGGREAVDQLVPYLKESHKGLLVFHELEQLPTALQYELAVHLSDSASVVAGFPRWVSVDVEGLQEYDVKVVATSTFSPAELELKGRVIPELLSKLCKRHVRIPSLAQRGPEDFRLLCEDMLGRIGARLEMPAPIQIEPAAMEILQHSTWRGNLADLVRVLEHAVWHSRGGEVRACHLPEGVAASRKGTGYPTLAETLAHAQRTAIGNALDHCTGDVAETARLLGVHKGTLYRLMEKLGMHGRRRHGTSARA